MPQSQISLPLTRDQAYALVDAIMERDDLALSASARAETDDTWVFEAICDARPDVDALNALARHVLGGSLDFAVERIDPGIDWVAKSLEGLKPVAAGGFYIYGSHNRDRVPGGMTALLIDAAQAFGTGHHQTTTGCLEAIERVLKRKKPRAMLDVGTGTGVLAIALAKRTRLPVVATDIDPVATATARANARRNQVGNRVFCVTAPGLANLEITRNGPYDLVVANILAGPLKTLAPAIGHIARPGATVILSGILHHQAARIVAAYRQADIVLERRIRRGEWSTLMLRRAMAPKRGAGI